jgi:predicted ATPase
MPNRLIKLQLTGFRSIVDTELGFNKLNVLIGANGAGKSNLIEFFHMLSFMLSSPSGALQRYVLEFGGGANRLLHDGAKRTREIEANLVLETDRGRNDYRFRLFFSAGDTLLFAEEACRFSRKGHAINPTWVELGAGHRESALLDRTGDTTRKKTERTIANLLTGLVVYHFQDTSKEARIKTRWEITDGTWLKYDAANLAPFLFGLRNQYPDYYRRTVETVRQVAPFFDDFVLEPEGRTLLLRWRERASDLIFDASQASDGMLRSMALITALMQPPAKLPALLIVDEPELGLHPYAITIIGGLIKAVAQNCQALIATQSPLLLDQFDPGDVIVVERDNRASTFHRESEERLRDWLSEYAMSDLWQKNILGGRPREEHYDPPALNS